MMNRAELRYIYIFWECKATPSMAYAGKSERGKEKSHLKVFNRIDIMHIEVGAPQALAIYHEHANASCERSRKPFNFRNFKHFICAANER